MKRMLVKPISAMLLLLLLLSQCAVSSAAPVASPYVTIVKSQCGGVEYTALDYTVPNSVSTLEGIWFDVEIPVGSPDLSLDLVGKGINERLITYSPTVPTSLTLFGVCMGTYPLSLDVGINTFSIILTINGVVDMSPTVRINRLPLPSSGKASAALDERSQKPDYEKLPIRSAGPVFEQADENSKQLGTVAAGENVSLMQWSHGEIWCHVLYGGGNNAGWIHRERLFPN